MKKVLLALFVLSFIFTGCDTGTTGCGNTTPGSDTDATVKITEKNKYVQIEPVGVKPKTCLIFYPGAMIEPASYYKPLQTIAEAGNRVLILKSMMNMAIFNVAGAAQAMNDFNDITNWVIGGHSLGGVAAIKAILKNPNAYKGLVLFASYPQEGDDLSKWGGAALSISAENDGLTTPDDIEASKTWLPQAVVVEDLADFPQTPTNGQTIFYEIPGGNHGQFGDYGEQKNDGQATISADTQHEIITDLMTRFFTINNW